MKCTACRNIVVVSPSLYVRRSRRLSKPYLWDRVQKVLRVIHYSDFVMSKLAEGFLSVVVVDSNPSCVFLSIKVKVKVKFSLEQATKAQRGSRGIALLFLQPRR